MDDVELSAELADLSGNEVWCIVRLQDFCKSEVKELTLESVYDGSAGGGG